jgi:hypothetical protein
MLNEKLFRNWKRNIEFYSDEETFRTGEKIFFEILKK